MKIKGKLIEKFETIQVTDKFKKRDVVVETADQYPQSLLVQFTQDKCAVLESYEIGQEVEIDINLRGRAWTNPQGEVKYFNTIEGWKISAVGGEVSAPAKEVKEEQEDLPF